MRQKGKSKESNSIAKRNQCNHPLASTQLSFVKTKQLNLPCNNICLYPVHCRNHKESFSCGSVQHLGSVKGFGKHFPGKALAGRTPLPRLKKKRKKKKKKTVEKFSIAQSRSIKIVWNILDNL